MNLQPLALLVLSFLFSAVAMGQGAHYTYPFTLSCPEGVVVSGETFAIGVTFEGGYTGEPYEPTYSWSVSHGTIVDGQGTKEVRLQFDVAAGDLAYVTLTRRFVQAHFPDVQRDASCQIRVVARPAARMTDEFQTRGNNCEDGLARLDAFLADLHNDPAASGVIAVYGDTTAKGASRIRELQLRRYARSRGFDLTRLVFVRGVPRVSGTTQLWLVPAGAEQPSVERAPLLAESRPKLPYMHSARYADGIPECSAYDYDVADYARTVSIEPRARARIVISETSRANFNRVLKELTEVLRQNGVSRRRIVAIYKYVRPNRLLESTELWVIRGDRKRR